VNRLARVTERVDEEGPGSVGTDMTAISQQQNTSVRENTSVRAEASQLDRTFAMILVGAGCWALAAGVAYFLAYTIVVYAPALGDERLVADVLPLFTLVAAILGVTGSLAVVWTGARRRPWFWLVPVILSVLLLVKNAPDLPYDLARPANTAPFLITIVVLAGALAAIVGGIAAFLEVRRGRPIWTRSGRVGWLAMAVIGIVVGAAMTSLLAGLASAGGPGVAEAPTITRVTTIEDTRFVESSLEMKDGEVLGLLVANPEDIWHSFDIDSLGIHVQLSPNSTTAVGVRPPGPGRLEFYCSIHGHRDAGMVGTIIVD
jgi:uncharacterized cupredoxin-like copper-binding protein